MLSNDVPSRGSFSFNCGTWRIPIAHCACCASPQKVVVHLQSRSLETSVVALQRDVPGFTRAAVPILYAQGVRGVTVGVNGGSAPPGVPHNEPFIWRDTESQTELLAMWHPGNPMLLAGCSLHIHAVILTRPVALQDCPHLTVVYCFQPALPTAVQPLVLSWTSCLSESIQSRSCNRGWCISRWLLRAACRWQG